MAKIDRKLMKIFGTNATAQQRGVFGSLAAGSPAYSTDPETIQSLSNYLGGWFDAVLGNNSPAIEDMNSLHFLFAYQLAYLMQAGIPEWNDETTYYIGSLATNSTGTVYVSRTDNNLNNILTNTTNWKPVGGSIMTAVGDILYGSTNGGATRLAGNITTAPYFLTQTGTGAASQAPTWRELKAPVRTVYLSGSGTHTFAAGVLWVKVIAQGGGGGGGGSGTASFGAGGNGGNTTFGTTLIAANGGTGGPTPTNIGGAGGTASLGSGPVGIALAGARGGGTPSGGITNFLLGGMGGPSAFGGATGYGGNNGAGTNVASQANTGAGGMGGGGSTGGGQIGGTGGGAGGYVDAIISGATLSSLGASVPYAVGAAGTGGTAGTSGATGAAGGSGLLIVEEHFQ